MEETNTKELILENGHKLMVKTLPAIRLMEKRVHSFPLIQAMSELELFKEFHSLI